MKSIIKITLSRHHRVEVPDFTAKKCIQSKEEGYKLFVEKMKEFIQNEGVFLLEENWLKVEQNILSFLKKEVDGVEEKVSSYLDNGYQEQSDTDVFIYANREENEEMNVFFSIEGQNNKDENRWMSYQFIEKERMEALRSAYEHKEKDELIDDLILHTV